MFADILVPVDLTEKGHSTVPTVARLAPAGARVTLLHVVETLEDVPFEEMEDFYRGLESRARDTLNGWAEELGRLGLDASLAVVFGHRAEEIVAYAEEHASDLVLMRSHAVDPVRPGRGWATVSYQVAALVACPVLLVK